MRQATIKLKVGAENVILIQPTMEMIVFATLDSSEIEINAENATALVESAQDLPKINALYAPMLAILSKKMVHAKDNLLALSASTKKTIPLPVNHALLIVPNVFLKIYVTTAFKDSISLNFHGEG